MEKMETKMETIDEIDEIIDKYVEEPRDDSVLGPLPPCLNYALCECKLEVCPAGWHGDGMCLNCTPLYPFCSLGYGPLQFHEDAEACAVCMREGVTKVEFPAGCGHSLCLECTRQIMFWDERRYYLSPEPFGCPPCPRGCVNPAKGVQCECDEHGEVREAWKFSDPAAWLRWLEDSGDSVERSTEELGSFFGSMTCPICRRRYERAGRKIVGGRRLVKGLFCQNVAAPERRALGHTGCCVSSWWACKSCLRLRRCCSWSTTTTSTSTT